MLLHKVPGGELKDVATGKLMQPGNRMWHCKPMDDAVMRVELGRVLGGCEDMYPPIQPSGADETLTLEGCHGYPLIWPKTQIRIGSRSTGASSIVRPKPPAAPVVVTATTSRHQKLLGASAPAPQAVKGVVAPRPPPPPPKGKAVAPQPPSPPPQDYVDTAALDANIEVDDDDDANVDAFINTGAGKGPFMPPLIEEPSSFRDEASRPNKKRLIFHGFSEETPPAAETQPPPAKVVFSPDTLHRMACEGIASPVEDPVDEKKKRVRKRPNKNKDKAASQPPPIRHRDDVVPPRQDGMTRCHVAGQPILTPDLRRLAGGDMMALQDAVMVLEGLLLKDKHPNYPVFTVKVPEHVDFVTDVPADVFFIAYEDIFKLFHFRRLDYNLVRLFALNLAMKVKREQTPYVAIADPYYMRDSQLDEGTRTRTRAKSYLQKLFLQTKRKDNILVPFFPE